MVHDNPLLSAIRKNPFKGGDRKSTRLNSSHQIISYAVFCLKKKNLVIQHLGIDEQQVDLVRQEVTHYPPDEARLPQPEARGGSGKRFPSVLLPMTEQTYALS